ncbi:hypothetical protein RF397_05430, partial [Acinetobacter baumannii]|nr:hypothetical protein [Acinetobacter baumannii]
EVVGIRSALGVVGSSGTGPGIDGFFLQVAVIGLFPRVVFNRRRPSPVLVGVPIRSLLLRGLIIRFRSSPARNVIAVRGAIAARG